MPGIEYSGHVYALFEIRKVFLIFNVKKLLCVYANKDEAKSKAGCMNTEKVRHIVERVKFINWF